MLRVRNSGSRQWVHRLTIHGRRVDLGLGSAELVKLADARKVAADNRAIARTGGEGSATVAAYARDDLLEKRRPVMQAWADCISG